MIRRNVEQRPRDPVPSRLRRRIAAELADDLSLLGELLGRDLSRWCGDAPAAGQPGERRLRA
jgi:hypothetical protein